MEIKYDKLGTGSAKDNRCITRCRWQTNHSTSASHIWIGHHFCRPFQASVAVIGLANNSLTARICQILYKFSEAKTTTSTGVPAGSLTHNLRNATLSSCRLSHCRHHFCSLLVNVSERYCELPWVNHLLLSFSKYNAHLFTEPS